MILDKHAGEGENSFGLPTNENTLVEGKQRRETPRSNVLLFRFLLDLIQERKKSNRAVGNRGET